MNFEELVQEVYNLTNRPDLVAETASAVRAATLKAHKSDYFSKDIYETGIKWDNASYKQSFDPHTMFSNYRNIKYIKRVKDEFDEVGKIFTIITPDEVLDSYNRNRTDVAYVAGRVIEIRSCVEFSKALFGCYVYPIIREGAYASWIAEQHPFAIIYEAVRVLFLSIGYQEQAAGMRELIREEYHELKVSAILDTGF